MQKEEFAKELGLKVSKNRENLDWSQEKLAEMAGVDRNTINRCENGKTVPSVFNLVKISKALKITLEELIY